MSRKYLFHNPKKLPKMEHDQKYRAIAIEEHKSENFNTYDDQSFTGRSAR